VGRQTRTAHDLSAVQLVPKTCGTRVGGKALKGSIVSKSLEHYTLICMPADAQGQRLDAKCGKPLSLAGPGRVALSPRRRLRLRGCPRC